MSTTQIPAHGPCTVYGVELQFVDPIEIHREERPWTPHTLIADNPFGEWRAVPGNTMRRIELTLRVHGSMEALRHLAHIAESPRLASMLRSEATWRHSEIEDAQFFVSFIRELFKVRFTPEGVMVIVLVCHMEPFIIIDEDLRKAKWRPHAGFSPVLP